MGFLHISITFLSILSLMIMSQHPAAADHVSTSSSSSPETYWKSVLPNTPIPKAISELLNIYTLVPGNNRAEETHPISVNGVDEHIIGSTTTRADKSSGTSSTSDGEHADDTKPIYQSTGALLILEKDMYQGHTMNLRFTKTSISRSSPSTFLPREVANTIPFSSNNLPELYTRFSIKPGSKESESMKKTIGLCEDEALKGEEKYCATCLEDMVDFTTSKLGKKVKAISTEVIHANKFQKYTIDNSRKVATAKFVNCHKRSYPYAVFYCHKVVSTRAYLVSLSGEDGSKAKAVAICHDNGAKLYPKDLVFKVLKVKPGTAPICHFLPEDHVVFVPY
uniref:BURP domain protein RD22-like n=1 Tax=Erigeron canadensis TaxID=72917 RepID=UPI001CB9082F|nr:BURP domain protein RD22-like [Erigeron canadensis]